MPRNLETFGGEINESIVEQSLTEVQNDLFTRENLEELERKVKGSSEIRKRAELYANRE